ncbi:Cinnamoyl-CoA reductase-like SNL6-like protein [Drosera capensis]
MKKVMMDDQECGEMGFEKPTVCVLDASNYVGFWILKGLLRIGYCVHAALQLHGEKEILKEIREMEKVEERLEVFEVDVLDYHSILDAIKGCSGLFCSLDSTEGYDDAGVELEVRGVINVMEACAQTFGIHRVVFSSSITAAIWRENITSDTDHIDERSWSDPDFCRKMKLRYALAKTLSEQAAWGLAMDRMLNMVSINAGLVLGPAITQHNSPLTMSYLKGAAEMYENGVLAYVDVDYLVDAHIRAFEDPSATGRYLCYNHVVNNEEETSKLVKGLSPLLSFPPSYGPQGKEVFPERLKNSKLSKLIASAA